jgi:hypothetical protein
MRHDEQGLRRLGPATQQMLQLLARCPRIPTDVICQLLGTRHVGSTRQLLARLRGARLAQLDTVASGALLNGRTVRLWSLTTAGRAELAKEGPLWSSTDLVSVHCGAPDGLRDPARQAVPLLLAAYRALGTPVVGGGNICTPNGGTRWRRVWQDVAIMMLTVNGELSELERRCHG